MNNFLENALHRGGSRISRWPIAERINAIDAHVVVALVFIGYFLSFSLNSNEEQYLQQAKQFYEPEWIKNSINLNEFAGTRLLYQYISGFFLSFLSFEHYVFWGRLALALLYALPLVRIYRTLAISNVGILLHLPVLFLTHQSMVGGAVIFISVEAKAFAYFFVFYALLFFIKGRYGWTTALLVVASYFHILVGGYALIYLGATVLFFGLMPWSRSLLLLAGYAIGILPFVVYLTTSITVVQPTTPSADWIYTYFRAPHHTALFQSLIYFYRTHFHGVLLAVIALLISLVLLPTVRRLELKRLNLFVVLSLTGTLVAVVLAYFDKTGQFVKYYPFRINALTTFAFTLHLTYLLTDFDYKRYAPAVNLTIVALAAFFTLRALLPNAFLSYQYFSGASAAFDEMSAYITNHTERDAVILYLGDPKSALADSDGDLSLTRKTRRSRFVSYKFIPAELSKIPDWYDRVRMKQAVLADIDRLPELKARYRVDYLLTTRDINAASLHLVKSVPPYFLYEIK